MLVGQYEQERYPATGKAVTSQNLFIINCRYSQTAADVREQFINYFCTSAGEVSWQYT